MHLSCLPSLVRRCARLRSFADNSTNINSFTIHTVLSFLLFIFFPVAIWFASAKKICRHWIRFPLRKMLLWPWCATLAGDYWAYSIVRWQRNIVEKFISAFSVYLYSMLFSYFLFIQPLRTIAEQLPPHLQFRWCAPVCLLHVSPISLLIYSSFLLFSPIAVCTFCLSLTGYNLERRPETELFIFHHFLASIIVPMSTREFTVVEHRTKLGPYSAARCTFEQVCANILSTMYGCDVRIA